ncbi:MAG: nuclear transport factor 2 family protein [Halioglobus sp.]
MSLEEKMVATVKSYLAGFEKKDLESIIDLYADDCWIEDPVGTERKHGKDALREFYQVAIDLGAIGSLESEIRVAGNEVAFAFTMNVDTGEGIFSTRPIDIMTFNEEGKITTMRAFWGPLNQSMA